MHIFNKANELLEEMGSVSHIIGAHERELIVPGTDYREYN